ncbi:MAG: amidohydrolase family protein [Clostridia bacterium]
MNSYLIKCGKLYDGIHATLQPDTEVLVIGNKIAEVGNSVPHPENTEIIDLSHLTVTPGMIDAHMHIHYHNWMTRRHEILFASPEYKTLSALRTVQKTLERGFTTIRQVGLNAYEGYGAIDVRRVIEKGMFTGSRMVCCPMYLTTRGGPGDQPFDAITNPWLADRISERYPTIGSGAAQFRDITRQQIKMGADYIKIMVSGSFMGENTSPEEFHFADDELLAIFETAHRIGKTCTAHAYGDFAVRRMVELGIDGIEHGSLIEKETIKLMEEKNTYLVPTFAPYEEIIRLDEERLRLKPERFQNKLRRLSPQLHKTRQMIIESNLRLGYGSDLVTVYQCYESGIEYRNWMRDKIDPFRILKAATSTNSEILGLQDKIGTIEKGKLADISGWKRDLLTDEDALRDCGFVMKDGVVYPAVSSINTDLPYTGGPVKG